ncbi:MAG: hypothetical protein RL226_113 [Bacteroidota bacterium]|jgi:ABC-2 type transport system ATP-binding protein
MIEIVQLSKSFSSTSVLKEVSATFTAGNVYGIVGENGSGKTTLFRCLAGLERYDGQIITTFSPLKNHVGFLPAEPYFMPRITGREYLRLLCTAREQTFGDDQTLNVFDLPLDQYASTYSTGMKKKLALTGVLLQRNQLFILDEPFNGVDIQSNLLITEVIRMLGEMGRCVLVSSHVFSTLRETCSELLLLKDGTLGNPIQRNNFDEVEKLLKGDDISDRIKSLKSRL